MGHAALESQRVGHMEVRANRRESRLGDEGPRMQDPGGLDRVREQPAAYIGDIGSRGLHQLAYAVVYNAVDEALAGRCDRIEVVVGQDGSLSVVDNGAGIPVGRHAHVGKPSLEVVLTTLHAGRRFGGDRVVGHPQGVCASVVNALSLWLEATVRRDGGVFRQRYERGVPVTPVEKTGTSDSHGTEIHFLPDPEIFDDQKVNFEVLAERCRDVAFLNSGVDVRLTDRRDDRHARFRYPDGIRSYVHWLNRGKQGLHDVPVHLHTTEDGVEVEAALQYTDGYAERLLSFANTIHTPEGGVPEAAFRTALARVVNDHGHKSGFLQQDVTLAGDAVCEGLCAVLSVKVKDPVFEGHAVRSIVETIVADAVGAYLEESPATARAILEKATAAARAREAARRVRELVRRKNDQR